MAGAQSYGRFGGDGLPQPLGFGLAVEGFRVTDAPSDTFQFLTPLADVKRVSYSDRHCEVSVRSSEGLPDGLRVNLRSPGFEMHVKGKVVLKLASLARPILTVEGVSFDGEPTPVAKWMAVSFRQAQPPVLFSVPEKEGLDWEIGGQNGAWTLTNRTPYEGWIRVSAPMGRSPISTENEELGEFANRLVQEAAFWTEPTTKLVSFTVSEQEGLLQAIWTFDRPNAVVPPALLLSRTGGAGIEIVSGLVPTVADLAEGPQGFSGESRWVFRFPTRRLPPGRALVQGELPEDASFERQMLALFTSAGDPVWGKKLVLEAGETIFGNGRAAYAESALERWGWKPTREGASPLQKALWSRDYSSLTLFGGTPAECAEAAGWLMLGLAAQDDPALRVEGCLLWTGLTSQRVLAEYRRKRGLPPVDLKNDVLLPAVIASAYGQKMDVPSAGWTLLNSPVRVLTSQRVVLEGDVLDWRPVPGEGPLKLRAKLETPLFEGVDGTQLKVELSPEFDWVLRAVPGPSGRCRVKAKLPPVPDLR